MPSVKTPPGMRRMWNSSRTGPDASRSTTFGAEPPDIVALDAAGLAVVATEAVATEARESGVAATGTLAMEVASDAIFQQQLHMLSRQPGVGPRVLHFDDELRHAWRQRQARHHARAARSGGRAGACQCGNVRRRSPAARHWHISSSSSAVT